MFTAREGQAVPQVTFHTRQGDQWVNVTTDELFKNKTVIVFSLPGAFTPTCSSSHLPRYNELAPVFARLGVDDILCVSVNDTFVMNAWKDDQKADRITFIPDGNGEFTAGMGMLVEKEELGFGKRSWRYSMLVRNGVVEKMFVEPEEPGDPFKVSDADTMLKYLSPEYKVQESVSIITKPGCPYCAKAKQMLMDKGIAFEEIILGKDATTVSLRAISGRTTVPQVFIGGKHIGGSDDLETYLFK
ncbi:glutathione peroxidase [Plesiomonas shigelloides subsp. oncorhynchi]|jgi:glutaredoxin-like protein|uniref:Peroxiredoxin family protein/glutaredoxin n=2 Tax=Plesiomonas shigelloides TaxID=703 RepID=R8ALV9_PLESH|nr:MULTISPECIES: glutathione peroxidase [Plesiomonas]MDO4688014.1 glutathione peroxidase [Plesiomonas sp.]EON87321.1 Peroxiredoxin family protein/glutaredoxin [Plesiomonas shigelloides 302-73]KAB7657429.1 redoxin family protein [Plesiomonas shigelloides]KAB7667387.1 redoxin family protein [Plesiomonas shigelloides]KAB7682983.1 redoxin family protein [Plesiomonas shigelloides]